MKKFLTLAILISAGNQAFAAELRVRLDVPAAQVGLEGRTLNGMAFSLYGGRATWDYAGKAGGAALPTYQVSGTVTQSGAALSGVNFAATGGVICSNSNGAGAYGCCAARKESVAYTPLSTSASWTSKL